MKSDHTLPTSFCHRPGFLRSDLALSVAQCLFKPDPLAMTTLSPLENTHWPACLSHGISDGFLQRAYITLGLSIINLTLSLSDLAFVIVQVISIIFSCESCRQAVSRLQSVLRFINMFKAAPSPRQDGTYFVWWLEKVVKFLFDTQMIYQGKQLDCKRSQLLSHLAALLLPGNPHPRAAGRRGCGQQPFHDPGHQ